MDYLGTENQQNSLTLLQKSPSIQKFRKASMYEQCFFSSNMNSPDISFIDQNNSQNNNGSYINGSFQLDNEQEQELPLFNLTKELSKIETIIKEEKQEDKKILIICLGGTISMVNSDQGLIVEKGSMQRLMKQYYHMYDPEFSKKNSTENEEWYITPKSIYGKRTWYQFYEVDEPIDSSNMETKNYIEIANIIDKFYHQYDGFIMFHGTDTMSYTASILSFLFENLAKTILITGAMVPFCMPDNDAYNNIICSLLIAGHFTFQEVTIFMNDKLIRGNRAKKTSSAGLDSFESPMFPPLAVFEQNMNGILVVNKENIYDNTMDNMPFHVQKQLCDDIIVIQINPCLNLKSIRSQLKDPEIKGVILETYGAGNIPSNKPELINIIKEAVERGIIVVNISQCYQSNVSPIYQTGVVLNQIGVVFGQDMTFESVLSKMQYVLAKDNLSFEEKKTMMGKSIRGELTELPETIVKRRETKESTIKLEHKQRANKVFPEQEEKKVSFAPEVNQPQNQFYQNEDKQNKIDLSNNNNNGQNSTNINKNEEIDNIIKKQENNQSNVNNNNLLLTNKKINNQNEDIQKQISQSYEVYPDYNNQSVLEQQEKIKRRKKYSENIAQQIDDNCDKDLKKLLQTLVENRKKEEEEEQQQILEKQKDVQNNIKEQKIKQKKKLVLQKSSGDKQKDNNQIKKQESDFKIPQF